MNEFFGGVIGFMVQMYGLLIIIVMFTLGLAVWDVSGTINRTIPLAMQHGGVDATVQSVVNSELQGKGITVISVTGSNPQTPFGSQISMKIKATFPVWGISQPIGQEVKATSTYNRRQ